MGLLEGRSRRKEKQQYGVSILKKTLFHQKRRKEQFQRIPLNDPHVKQHALLPLDSPTAARIQCEFLALQSNSHRSCSLLSLTNALAGSFEVKDLYVKMRGTTTQPLLRPQLRGKKDNTSGVERRYEFIIALKRLETMPGATGKFVSTWEEARQELSAVFEFPDDMWENDLLNGQSSTKESAMEEYTKRFNAITLREASLFVPQSRGLWQQVANASLSPKIIQGIVENLDRTDLAMKRRLEDEYRLEELRNKNQALEQLEKQRKEKEAAERAASLMRPLTAEEKKIVKDALYNNGPPDEVIAQVGTDSIQRSSMQTLRPGGWLSDEVIHYFYVMLAKRDEELCRQDPKRKRSHFFKSFFFTTLLNEGHSDPNKNGVYDYKNVKRWSKKVPGKDIFKLDKIFFPINQNNMHWVCAVIFMQLKKIQFYDSMGGDGQEYLDWLFRYVKDEYKAKHGSPLPDADEWELVKCTRETPQQRNGFDCGVFTCMYADFLSKDCPLVFDQSHITQCRERIAVSIMLGQAIL